LRAATPAHAEEFALKCQAAISAMKIPHPGTPGSLLSATFGVAWHPAPARCGITAQQLYSAADNTLYAAKQAGRNRVLMRIMQDPERA